MSALAAELKKNHSIVEIVSSEQLLEMANARAPRPPVIPQRRTPGLLTTAQWARDVADYKAPFDDVATAGKLARELGFTGKVYVKNVQTLKGLRQYVILKGYPGRRAFLTGTRYLANNAKIVSMAIGRRGVNGAIIGGFKITVKLAVPLNVLLFLLDDNMTLCELFGKTATDIAKVGLSSLVASAAAAGAGVAFSAAVAPIAVAILVGVALGFVFEELDNEYGITKKLVAKLNSVATEAGDTARQSVRNLCWRAYCPEGPFCLGLRGL